VPQAADVDYGSTNIGRHITLHQVHVVTTGAQAEVPPTMLAVERKRSCVRGTDAQLGGLHAVATHEIHCVVLKFAADARATHLLDQVEEVHVSASRLFEDLHLHLSDDPIAVPGMNVPIPEPGGTKPKPLDVVCAVRPGLMEEVVHAEAADERVTTKRHAHLRMHVEIDWLEDESLRIHLFLLTFTDCTFSLFPAIHHVAML